MKYVKREEDTLSIVFHNGPLPAELESKIVALAPKDAEYDEGDLITLIEDPQTLFGNAASFDGREEEREERKRLRKEARNQVRIERAQKAEARRLIGEELKECDATGDVLKILQYLGLKE